MPLPIILIWIAGALLVGGGAALGWNELVFKLKGKRLAILGEREVGKTVLTQFMTTGTVPSDYKETVAPEATSRNHLKLIDLALVVHRSFDVGGGKANYGEWRRGHDEADLVFYLLRADRLGAGRKETLDRVINDLTHIKGWREARQKAGQSVPTLVIIGTHCDLDPAFEAVRDGQAGEYLERFKARPSLQKVWALAGGMARVPVVLGSLETDGHRKALVYNVLQVLQTTP